MSLFPSSPSNGDTVNVNGIVYTYSSSQTAWVRTGSFLGNVIADTGNFTGNVTANFFIGNGSQLTGITSSTANTVTNNAQPNITSVGTLASLIVTGNITGGNFVGSLANGTSSINIPAANGNININTGGGTTELIVTSTGVSISGTLSTGTGVITGNGSGLTALDGSNITTGTIAA